MVAHSITGKADKIVEIFLDNPADCFVPSLFEHCVLYCCFHLIRRKVNKIDELEMQKIQS